MHIEARKFAKELLAADAVFFPFFKGQKRFSGIAAEADEAFGGALSEEIAAEEATFKGGPGECLVLRLKEKDAKAGRLIALGFDAEAAPNEGYRAWSAAAIRKARQLKAKRVALIVKCDGRASTPAAIAEGLLLGDYAFHHFKEEDRRKHDDDKAESVTVFIEASGADLAAAMDGIAGGMLAAKATILARDLVNLPSSHATPTALAKEARRIADAGDARVTCRIFDEGELQEMGANCILAVGKGSAHRPLMIHLRYSPSGKARKTIAIVGKGITFDSGGLSIKPAKSMEDMKMDMAGCAAMLGVFSVIREVAPDVEVHGISAVCENMPSGSAYRPGDVVCSLSGQTVEVLNTDAEGRVTLADALYYAAKFIQPDALIDIATLTGAIMVGLGDDIAGLFSNDDKLAAAIEAAAKEAGEALWRMPLHKPYRKSLDSRNADIKHISGGSYGGAITAALFLQHFVDKRRWVHLDIAGPAHGDKERSPYEPAGATGFGVRTLLRYLQSV